MADFKTGDKVTLRVVDMNEAIEMVRKLANDAEHLVNILERKACEEWSYDYQRETIKRARELIRPAELAAGNAGQEDVALEILRFDSSFAHQIAREYLSRLPGHEQPALA